MKNKNLTTGIIIVAIIVIVTISAAYYQNTKTNSISLPNSANEFAEDMQNSSNESDNYTNGIYEATGNYISPGGAEQIGVSITLEEGVIVDSNVEVLADRDISLEMQEDFAANYKSFVLGKSIDEVELTKVSGSSLTPNGFNDAIEKIKVQARS